MEGLTLEQLQGMGAKPMIPQSTGKSTAGLTLEQLQGMGAKPINSSEISITKEPLTITKIAGGFQETIGATGETFGERLINAGKKIGGKILDVGKSVITHPISTLGGVEKGVMDFTFNVSKGVSKLIGADNAAKYIEDNQNAINEIFNSNLKEKDQKTAADVGHFVGEQIPYILGGAGAVALGEKVVIAGVGKFGQGLTLKNIERLGKITAWTADTLGFMGVHQLVHTPEEGTRMDAVKNDLLVLGALGAIGLTGSAIKDAKMRSKIRSFVSDIPNKSLENIEIESKKLLDDVKTTTGKDPKVLAGETLNQYSINVKDLSPTTKMGDIAKVAESRGFSEYGNIQFKPTKQEETKQIKKVLTSGNVQQVNRQAEQFGGKVSGMWERVSKDIPQAEQDVMNYKGITLQKSFDEAVNVVESDSAKAYRIAMNLEKSSSDTTNTMVNRVLAEKAKQDGNLELQTELIKNRTLSQIRRGQEIVTEREIKGGLARDNAGYNMKQILDERKKIFESKTKTTIKQATEKEVQSFKSKIKIVNKADFDNFIDKITC